MTSLNTTNQLRSTERSKTTSSLDLRPIRIGCLGTDRSLSRWLHLTARQQGAELLDAALLTPRERAEPIAALLRRKIRCLLIVGGPTADTDAAGASCDAAGIPTIVLGRHVGSTGTPSDPTNGHIEFLARADLVAYACQSLQGNRGEVAYLHEGESTADSSLFRAAVAGSAAFPNVVLTPVTRSAHTDPNAGFVPALEAGRGGFAAVVASTDKLALEATAVFAGRGVANPPIYGFGGDLEALLAIQRGELAATVVLDREALARRALESALQAISKSVTHAALAMEYQRVTKDNVGEVIAHACVNHRDLADDLARRLEAQGKTTDFLEQVIDTLPLNLFVKDAEHLRYIRINKARAHWFGIEPEDHLGKSARDLYPPDLAERFEASDREVLHGRKGSLPDEHPTVSPRPGAEGGTRYVQTSKLPVCDEAGNPEYLLGITLDVTERKTAELALAQRNDELEAAQVTTQKQQTKLIIAEKMASIGRLTAGIAHEMNTPLAAVRASMSELLALVNEYVDAIGDSTVSSDDHREIAGEMKAAISIADKSAARASTFVRGIKGQTRGLSGNPRVSFNAVVVIQESILLLSHALRDANCTARFECSTFDGRVDYVELVGSPASFAQAVTNLVTNAIDASRPNGGEIRLELVSSGDRVSLRVTDHGCGIPPEIISNIFEPMFTTKPFGQGTGLGLSILHDIVTAEFDGTVEVSSTVGQGTTFELFLKLAADRLVQ